MNRQPDYMPVQPDSSQAVAEAETSSPPVSLAPPPPSAPAEFLSAQWLITAARDVIRPEIAPPPASAPGEFLISQYLSGEWPEVPHALSEKDIFSEAQPPAVLNAEELACLSQEISVGAEFEDGQNREGGASSDPPPVTIRSVPLEAGEEISQIFLPHRGLVTDVPNQGQALILTSKRLIAFRGVEGFRDTHYALVSEISQCTVRTGQRNWGAIWKGILVMAGGAVLYLVMGYWLAGRISGPNIPVLNVDLAPLVAIFIILLGALLFLVNCLTRPEGAMVFHGEGIAIEFPFRSSLDLGPVYALVDEIHSAHRNRQEQGPED